MTTPHGDLRPDPPILDDGDVANWQDLSDRVSEMSTPHLPFYFLVTLSTTIAAYGLLANSTAVVIGAMLVAPLMGPIFGIALALATGDNELLVRSAKAEAKGVALAVGLAVLIGLMPNQPNFGTEILARTRPTVYDLIVAVASGLAGAFALADKRVSVALPGVAIATAIVPPLATLGLCIAAREYQLASGALILFLANLLAIEVAAVVYFTIVGVRRGHLHEHFRLGPFLRHFGVSVLLLIVVGAFLTQTLVRGIADERRRDRATGLLEQEVRITQGARLSEITIDASRDTVQVLAAVLTPQEIRPEQVAALQAQLAERLDEPVFLVVRSIISRDASSHGPVFIAEDELVRRDSAARQTQFLTVTSALLRQYFARTPGVDLEEIRRERTGSLNTVTAVVRTPTALLPAQVDSLEQVLAAGVSEPVRLIVRSVLTRDADAIRFLYDSTLVLDSPPPDSITPAAAPPSARRGSRR